MSKIKDLLAEEQGIEDLMPEASISKSKLLEAMEHVISDNAKDIRDELYEFAEFDVDTDEEGHETLIVRNFDDMCDGIAESYVEDYVYQQHIDINDDDYGWVVKHLQQYVAESFDSCYWEIIKEAEEDD
jgi:hypothetical protein